MADPTPLDTFLWPITNTMVHTRGVKTEVAVHRLGAESGALILRFGGASDVTVHVQNMEEINDIHRQLGFALDAVDDGLSPAEERIAISQEKDGE